MTVFLLTLSGFCAGFVDAIAGGGGLISLPAFLILQLPPAVALGTNKMVGISTAIASTSRYGMSGAVQFRPLLPLFALSFLGALTGATLASKADPTFLRPVIFILLLAVAIFSIVKKNIGLVPKPDQPQQWVAMRIFSLFLGFYDGFFGPGTGAFFMIAFVLLHGKDLLNASASARLLNLASNLGALIVFIIQEKVLFHLAAPAAIASFVGGILGAHFAVKKGAALIRPVYLVIVWLLILRIGYQLVVG